MISVIVPLRGEPPGAAERFRWIAAHPEVEVVVADGGGNPATAEAFRGIGARVLCGKGSRGARLAEAAAVARGETLLFLHSDSRLANDALEALRRCMESGAAAGAFSLAYENASPAMRWIALWANLRSRWLLLPFGDQGIFCRRDAYDRAGGFRDLAVCDDLDFVRRLRSARPFVLLPQKTTTSPRRYRSRGTFTQMLVNWKVQAGYFAGVAPATLERWYNGKG